VSPARLLEQARTTLRLWQCSAAHVALSWPHRDGDREYLASPLLSELPVEQRAREVQVVSGVPVSSARSSARVAGTNVRPYPAAAQAKRSRTSAPLQASLAFDFADPADPPNIDRPNGAPASPGSELEAGSVHASRPLTLAHLLRATRVVESYEDAIGVPWPRAVPVPAGTRTIEYQNRCPVRAYAELRLACSPMETPRPGVDFRERGTLLHRALELLWTRLGGSQALHAAKGGQLEAMIEESVARAMADAFGSGGVYQQNRALLREHRRAARLIRELCELELQRPPFRVSALEARRNWSSLAGCSLDLRIDRIDELEDGTHIIFDYKSGAPQSQDWLGDRITYPQLLVYMLAVGEPVTGLATIQLNSMRIGFRGIADRKGRLPRVSGIDLDGDSSTQRWQAQQERWRHSVEQLAADFLAGVATLNPMENACRICHLHAFCRIGDAAISEAASDD
jgi:ATP-dependent helicase/nuclease subunit B